MSIQSSDVVANYCRTVQPTWNLWLLRLRTLLTARPRGKRSVKRSVTSNFWPAIAVEALERRQLLTVAPIGTEFQITPADGFVGTDYASKHTVATDAAGNFVVIWLKHSAGTARDVYARRFDADGAPLSDEFRVNTTTALVQSWPSIAMSPTGEFVITWTDNRLDPPVGDGMGSAILGQRFDATGTPDGPEFRVDTPVPAYRLGESEVAMDAAGNFVVTWWVGQATGNASVLARRFNADAQPLSADFMVNIEDRFVQFQPDIAMSPSGAFVITWTSGDLYNEIGDLNHYGVFAMLFDASGSSASGEIQVNTSTFSKQEASAVAMDSDGNFTVVFMSLHTGLGYNVLGQRFAANGSKVGGEFLANTNMEGASLPLGAIYPRIGRADDGTFAVCWLTQYQDGSEFGVYAQQYAADGSPLGDNFRVNTRSQHRDGASRQLCDCVLPGYGKCYEDQCAVVRKPASHRLGAHF